MTAPSAPSRSRLPHTVIVVPCYNEADRLDAAAFTTPDFPGQRLEFCFVNDGSRDRTGALLATIAANAPDRCWVVDLAQNQGKAEAVRAGVRAALEREPDFIGFWDADLATPLAALTRFWAAMDAYPEVEMVLGSRVKLLGRNIERSPLRHYLGRFGATLIALTLGLPVYDSQCGAKLFRRTPHLGEVFAQPFLARWIFDVEILARYQALLADPARALHELPLDTWRDVPGSKIGGLDFFRSLRDLRRIHAAYPRRRDSA